MQGMGQCGIASVDQCLGRSQLRWIKVPLQALFAVMWTSRQFLFRFVGELPSSDRSGLGDPDP